MGESLHAQRGGGFTAAGEVDTLAFGVRLGLPARVNAAFRICTQSIFAVLAVGC